MQGRVGVPPLTHLRGVLAKPETRSAEAGAAIASRRNAAEAAESWDADGAASLDYEARRCAKEGKMVVLTVKDNRAATSLTNKPRSRPQRS